VVQNKARGKETKYKEIPLTKLNEDYKSERNNMAMGERVKLLAQTTSINAHNLYKEHMLTEKTKVAPSRSKHKAECAPENYYKTQDWE